MTLRRGFRLFNFTAIGTQLVYAASAAAARAVLGLGSAALLDAGAIKAMTVSTTEPVNPAEGDLWYNETEGTLYVYYNAQWVVASPAPNATTVSTTPPPTPSNGDLWWKSDEGRLKVYYDDGTSQQWVDASPVLQRADLVGQTWDFNYAADGDQYIRAAEAMTVTHQASTGAGSISFEKSTAAAPDTFAAANSPVTLEAGAKLKVVASGVTATYAVHLERTA